MLYQLSYLPERAKSRLACRQVKRRSLQHSLQRPGFAEIDASQPAAVLTYQRADIPTPARLTRIPTESRAFGRRG